MAISRPGSAGTMAIRAKLKNKYSEPEFKPTPWWHRRNESRRKIAGEYTREKCMFRPIYRGVSHHSGACAPANETVFVSILLVRVRAHNKLIISFLPCLVSQ